MKQALLIISLLLFTALMYAQDMQGSYSVGSDTADFSDLNEAIAALQSSTITGDVLLDFLPGTYSGAFLLQQIESGDHRITLSSGVNATGDVILTNDPGSENYIIKIVDTSNITIEGLSFNSSGSDARVVHIFGDSNNISILNCDFQGYGTGTSNNEIIYLQNDNQNDADNILIEGNTFSGGSHHVRLNSSNYNNNSIGVSIKDNMFENIYAGISLIRASDVLISGNTMNGANIAISLESCSGDMQIKNNNVSAFAMGISLISADLVSGDEPHIYNNIIKVNGYNWYGGYGSSAAFGLYLFGCEDVKAVHNSILNSSATASSAAGYVQGTRNHFAKNIFVSMGKGYALHFSNANTGSNRNQIFYNNLYCRSAYLAKDGNTELYEINDVNTVTGFTNIDYNPFYHDEFLHSQAPRLNNFGSSVGVTEDYAGNPRSTINPDPGAHEYDGDPSMTPMGGSYQIGVGGNYETLAEFSLALSYRGIIAPITANLTDALYNEQFVLDRTPGSGHDRVIEFRGNEENLSTIKFNPQGAENNHIVRLYRSAYVMFNRINFETESSTYSNMIFVEGFAKGIEVLDCSFTAGQVSTNLHHTESIGADDYANIRDITIESSSFFGNGYGIRLRGSQIDITANVFQGQEVGISLDDNSDCYLGQNLFQNIVNTALYLNVSTRGVFSGNRIHSRSKGIVIGNSPASEQYNLIANNAIYIEGNNASSGIWLGSGYIKILNNSVHVSGNIHSSGLYMYQNQPEVEIANNIFSNSDGIALDILHLYAEPLMSIDYNVYYSESNYLVRMQDYHEDIHHLQAALPAFSLNSVCYNPLFDDVLFPQSSYLRDIAMPRTEFSDDINGFPRGELWDMGAFEQSNPTVVIPMAGSYSVGSSQSDYATLDEALSDVQMRGISDDVNLVLVAGVYEGYHEIYQFPKAHSFDQLTIIGSEAVFFELDPQYSQNDDNYIFKLIGADAVCFTNLQLSANPSGNSSNLIFFKGRCDNISIQNSSLQAPLHGNAIKTGTSLAETLIIEYCNFTGSGNAILIPADPYDDNRYRDIRIQNNEFNNVQFGISINNANAVSINSNCMNDISCAINLSNIGGASLIHSNRMISPSTGSQNGMMILNRLVGSSQQSIDIYNNVIYITGLSNYYFTGIGANNCSFVNLNHNTITVKSNYGFDYGQALNLTYGSSMLISNNIFSSPQNGRALSTANNTDVDWLSNVFYATGRAWAYIQNQGYVMEDLGPALADPVCAYADPMVNELGDATCSYLNNRGSVTSLMVDINGDEWQYNSDPGATVIPAGDMLLTEDILVGAAGQYSDLQSAFNDLMNRGIGTDIHVMVSQGEYVGQAELGFVPGVNYGNSISIQNLPGEIVVLKHMATGSGDNYILKLRNTYHTSIKGFSFSPQNPEYSIALQTERMAWDLDIRECSFDIAENQTSQNSSAIYSYQGYFKDLRIEDNFMENYGYAIYLYGNDRLSDCVIEANEINDAYIGMYLYEHNSVVLRSNRIQNFRYNGMYLSNINNSGIYANTSVGISGSSYALRNQPSYALTGSNEVHNNYFCSYGSQVVAISNSSDYKIYNNTMLGLSSNSQTDVFSSGSNSGGIMFFNNICVATAGSSARFSALTDLDGIGYNIYYSPSGGSVKLASEIIDDPALYADTFDDENSLFADPHLTTGTYMVSAASPAINAGLAIIEITRDIEGRLRDIPDIGCWEYYAQDLGVPQDLSLSIIDGDIIVQWSPVTGAASYMLYFADSPNPAHWDSVIVDTNQYVLPTPNQGRLFFKVTAIN